MLCRVYYNLHLRCYSVQSKTERGWRLAFHAKEIALKNVKFRVYELARQRVIRTGKKNVHAFLLGETTEPEFREIRQQVKYNPFAYANFVVEDGSPVHEADYVYLSKYGVFI